jgi:hypothetical protein
MIDCLPMTQVMRKQSSGIATSDQVEDGIDDLALTI